ncbi:hypothetical protein EDD22DRAFT_231293 [Suillus occidentalis]|nr:hypothetical protein EDD22DRAFT_231293 [Suillus occidentalis]
MARIMSRVNILFTQILLTHIVCLLLGQSPTCPVSFCGAKQCSPLSPSVRCLPSGILLCSPRATSQWYARSMSGESDSTPIYHVDPHV